MQKSASGHFSCVKVGIFRKCPPYDARYNRMVQQSNSPFLGCGSQVFPLASMVCPRAGALRALWRRGAPARSALVISARRRRRVMRGSFVAAARKLLIPQVLSHGVPLYFGQFRFNA